VMQLIRVQLPLFCGSVTQAKQGIDKCPARKPVQISEVFS
jgi:hypothetical protein